MAGEGRPQYNLMMHPAVAATAAFISTIVSAPTAIAAEASRPPEPCLAH